MQQYVLSIIIPALNEEQRLPATLEAIEQYLKQQAYAAEVIVVDDGSTDATAERARAFGGRLALRVLSNGRNTGKGSSVRRGMLEAGGAWRLFTDADLSTPIAELEKFWPEAEQGAQVIIGSRALRGARIERRQPWYREAMGRTFNRILQVLGVRGIHDTQCGFKLFSAAAAQQIFPPLFTRGFAFDVEALLRARRLGLEIREVPVRWINSPDSRVHLLRDSTRMLLETLRMRVRFWKGE